MNRRIHVTNRRHSAVRLLVSAGFAVALLLGLLATGSSSQQNPVSPEAIGASSQAPITFVFREGVSPDPFYSGVADTYIALYNPEENYGGLGTMRMHSGSGGRERLLIKFDISRIPTSVYVLEAQLYLLAWYRTQPYNLTVYAYRVRKHWNELDATWNRATSSDFWAASGCMDPLFDYDPAMFATTTVRYTDVWYTWDLTEMAQGWVSSPASNEGVLLVGEGLSNQYQFRTSEIPATNLRPYLVVTYSSDAPTPEPTSSPTQTLTPVESPTPTSTATATNTPTATLPVVPPTKTPTPMLTPQAKAFQQGLYPTSSYTGVGDTFLSFYRPDTPWSSDDGLRISGRENGSERVLVRFDLDGHFPANAYVHSAKLSLFAWSRRTLYGLRISAYDVLRPWDVGEATWNEAYASGAWGIPGCDQAGSDREGDPAASRFTYFTNYFYEWDITPLVQQWVADAETNRGVVLIGHPVDQEMRFRSSEWRVLEQRPRLSVVYSAP
jgi:hypothetical protein